MKVKALIEELKKHDPDKQVVIRGYEDGYNDILKIYEINIFPNPGQKNCIAASMNKQTKKKKSKFPRLPLNFTETIPNVKNREDWQEVKIGGDCGNCWRICL